jgi:hypothetical protein
MNVALDTVIVAAALFVGLLGAQEVGLRFGRRRRAAEAEGARAGLGAVEGAVFGLMGLMIAFSFHGASSRYDTRRHLIVQEANAIGTAYLRLDVLPAGAQPKLKDLLRRYLDARLEIYRKLPDVEAARQALEHSIALQGEIWASAVEALREAPQAAVLVLPALNAMFDIATERTVALQSHPPKLLFGMLAFLALACALLAGFGMAGGKARSVLHVLGFATILTLTVYVILDLEFPRVGLIRLDAMDKVLADVRQSMK